MLSTLAAKIRDNRFLRLMRNMLKAGYLQDWVWNATLSGVPQGRSCAAAHNPPYLRTPPPCSPSTHPDVEGRAALL
jgi:hypothetical protein